MILSKIELVNWKNFHKCDVELSERTFIVGANASGKSNFLDAFRFLHDVAKAGGGLQTAVSSRGGLKKIRCLAARIRTDIEFVVHVKESFDATDEWVYTLAFKGIGGGIMKKEVVIIKEEVKFGEEVLLSRSIDSPREDTDTLKYTHLEQANANQSFRELRNFFVNIEYLNVVPQLVRESNSVLFSSEKEDFYGRNFMQRLAKMNKATSAAYFRRVNEVLRLAVPQLSELQLAYDEMGVPHLEARYEHWRAQGSKQQEEQFSDGTLRLIGFLFALLDSKGIVLLEEPETNLHSAIVAQLPEFIAKLQRSKKETRQVFITTHSYDMLATNGLSSEEVILLKPSKEGTEVISAANLDDVNAELRAGFSMADAIMPYTKPENVDSISMLKI
ncbi:MAG: AAA family ATPase [Paludibacteraceae bacterium]|nr:AAA family ATPase [Paludibacteraceae bacterium]